MITKEELIKKIEVCNPCSGGLRWAKTKKTAKDILENVCKEWRAWALVRGIAEFEEYCDWEEFDISDWLFLLSKRPKFIDKCNWLDEFHTEDWKYLLSKQPKLAKYREKIS